MGAVVAVTSGDRMWFFADFWGLAADVPGGLPHLLEPHAGHPSLISTAAAVLIERASGLGDAAVWIMAPRALAWAVLVATVWLVCRMRGADPRVALGTAAVLTVYGGSGWIVGWLAGPPIAFSLVVLAAWLVTATDDPSWARVAAVGAVALIAVSSSSLALIGVAVLAVSTAVARRSARWLVAFVAVGTVYVAWRSVIERPTRSPSLEPDVLLGLPLDAISIARAGYARFLTVPDPLGWAAVAAVVVALVALAVRRRLDLFDATVVLWAGAYVAATVTLRIAAGQASVETVRYGYVVVLLTILLLVPRVRLPGANAATAAVLLVTAVLGVRNAAVLTSGLTFWENRSLASREVVETAGALLAAGEPSLPQVGIDGGRAGMLTSAQLLGYLDDGWDPGTPSREDEPVARGDLRVRVWPAGTVTAPCRPLDAGVVAMIGDGDVLVGSGVATIRTVDAFGEGTQPVLLRGAALQVAVLDTATATVDTSDPGVELCPARP